MPTERDHLAAHAAGLPEGPLRFDAAGFETEYRTLEARLLAWMRDPSPDEDAFDTHALAAHRFQVAWNRPYRRFCRSVLGASADRDPAATSVEAIPAVPAEAFRDAELPVACFPPGMAEVTFRTSGTTGDVRGLHHFFDTTLYREAVRLGWSATAGLARAPVLALMPSPADAPESSLSFMFGELAEPDHFFIGRDGTIAAEALAQAIGAFREPVVLAGTAIALLHLMEAHPDLPIRLPEGSRILQTGGYKGTGRSIPKAELHERLAARFSVPAETIVDEYGMTELSSQFYATGCGSPHHGPHWARIRLVDPESGAPLPEDSGRPGLLEILDVANLGSVIALRTRDLAVRHADGFRLLGRDPSALPRGCSRGTEALITRDGPATA